MSQQVPSQPNKIQPQQHTLTPISQFYANNSLKQSKVHSIISHSSNPQNLLKYFQQYQALSLYLQQRIKDVHKSQNLKLKKYKQSVYYGQFINGKRQGIGIMIYDNNRIYQGDWSCDYKHGKGYQKFENQSVYIGNYVNGKPQGIGKYVWPNGQFYQGQWLTGLKHGTGMWKSNKGDSYIGQWKHGKADGYGVHTWINGDRYQGQFKQSLKHGQGIQKFKNGDIYKGLYKQGKPQGYGQYYWQNGSYFKGQFKSGLRNGQGIWKNKHGNSDKYQGQYKNDKKQGYGIFIWANGNVYKGQYVNDSREGYGQMFWTNGSWYKGQWRNGIQNGMGELYIPGENVKKGIFQNNILITVQDIYSLEQNNHIPAHRTLSNPRNNNTTTAINSIHNIQRQSNYSHTSAQKKSSKSNIMPTKIQFRTYNQKSRNKSRQPKSVDQNIVIRYGNPTVQIPHSRNNINKNNMQHPLLPKKLLQRRQQKYVIFQRNIRNGKPKLPMTREKQRQFLQKQHQSQREQKQRILHSAFYMHQFHNRAATSIHASRAQAKSGYSSSLDYGRGQLREDKSRDRDREKIKGQFVVRKDRDSITDGNSLGLNQKTKQIERNLIQKPDIQQKQKADMSMIQQMRYYNKMRLTKNAKLPNF